MLEQQPSDQILTEEEVRLELSLQEGEGAESLSTLEGYMSSKQAFFDTTEKIMQGQAGPVEEAQAALGRILKNTAESFVQLVHIDGGEAGKAQVAGTLLHRSAVELSEFVARFSDQVEFTPADVDTCIEGFQEAFEAYDPSLHDTVIEQSVGSLYSSQINELLEQAPASQEETEQLKRAMKIERSKKIAIEASKVALGAAVFAVVNRFMGKK